MNEKLGHKVFNGTAHLQILRVGSNIRVYNEYTQKMDCVMYQGGVCAMIRSKAAKVKAGSDCLIRIKNPFSSIDIFSSPYRDIGLVFFNSKQF